MFIFGNVNLCRRKVAKPETNRTDGRGEKRLDYVQNFSVLGTMLAVCFNIKF